MTLLCEGGMHEAVCRWAYETCRALHTGHEIEIMSSRSCSAPVVTTRESCKVVCT